MFNKSDYDKAIADLQKSLEIEPDLKYKETIKGAISILREDAKKFDEPDDLSHYVKSDLDGGNRTIICRCKRVPKLVFINNMIEKYHCEYCDSDFEIKRIK